MMNSLESWEARSAELGELCQSQDIVLTGAESCTGGLIAAIITSVSGSSAWFDRAFITYSNEAKQQLIGVQAETLAQYGAVSEQTAQEMAQGALQHSGAQLAYAVTGVAGPTGGTVDKPVGMVCFGFAMAHHIETQTLYFPGDRAAVREQTAAHVLEELARLIDAQPGSDGAETITE